MTSFNVGVGRPWCRWKKMVRILKSGWGTTMKESMAGKIWHRYRGGGWQLLGSIRGSGKYLRISRPGTRRDQVVIDLITSKPRETMGSLAGQTSPLSNQPETLTSADPNTKTKSKTSWKKLLGRTTTPSIWFKTTRPSEKILSNLTVPVKLFKKGFSSSSNTGAKCCATFTITKSMFKTSRKKRRPRLCTTTRTPIYLSKMTTMTKWYLKLASKWINRPRSQ